MTVTFVAVMVVMPHHWGLAGTTTESRMPPNSIGVRLIEVPESRVDDPRARSAVIDHVIPGATITRAFEVISSVDDAITVALEAENAQIVNGAFVPDPSAERGIADWISTSPDRLDIGPSGRSEASFSIQVPPSTPTGEYYGIVYAEAPPGAGVVRVNNRVGLRIYLSVGTGDEPPVDFQVGQMTAGRDSEGVPYIATDLRNTGGRALDITGEIRLSEGPADLSAGPFAFPGAATLAPGEIYPLRITLDPELPDGPWLAELRAVAGLLERTAEAEVLFPTEAGGEAPSTATELTGGTDAEGNDISERLRGQRRALLPLAALLILLALGALWLMLLWKRRQDEEDEESQQAEKASARVSGGSDDSG